MTQQLGQGLGAPREDEFGRSQSFELRQKGFAIAEFSETEIPGSEIHTSQPIGVAMKGDGCQEVVPLGPQQAVVEMGSR